MCVCVLGLHDVEHDNTYMKHWEDNYVTVTSPISGEESSYSRCYLEWGPVTVDHFVLRQVVFVIDTILCLAILYQHIVVFG